jgi:hypothetical protein
MHDMESRWAPPHPPLIRQWTLRVNRSVHRRSAVAVCLGSLSLCDSHSRTGGPVIWLEIQPRGQLCPLPRLQFPTWPVIPHHGHASALGMRLQALQGFNERYLLLPPRSPDVGHATKHLDISVARHDFPLHLISSKALQAIKKLLGCDTIMLSEPCAGGLPSQRPMSPDIIAVVHVSGRIFAEGLQDPLVILPVKVVHVVSERAFQFAVGLWVIDRGVDQADPHVLTKRDQEPSLEWRPVVENHGVGHHALLAHGRDERVHGCSPVWIEGEIAQDVAAGIIVHERELIGHAIQIREGHLLQDVPMPEARRVVSFIEGPTAL